jgi:hypothetical protein
VLVEWSQSFGQATGAEIRSRALQEVALDAKLEVGVPDGGDRRRRGRRDRAVL